MTKGTYVKKKKKNYISVIKARYNKLSR